jgi:hypothetical protein
MQGGIGPPRESAVIIARGFFFEKRGRRLPFKRENDTLRLIPAAAAGAGPMGSAIKIIIKK